MEYPALTLFHPLVRQWFSRHFAAPTEAQTLAWPLIQNEKHVLVSAPTGSGKTLTAFLAALDKLLSGAWEGGHIRVLYLSPLKALGNDIRRNLLIPLAELQDEFTAHGQPHSKVKVLSRTGDTSQDERRSMLRHPPEILITTPESLGLLLTGQRSRSLFSGLKAVIIDEIHALAGTKRGAYTMAQVERLTLSAGEFQRIGLSATVHPVERIASWMGGFQQLTATDGYQPRQVIVVQSRQRRPPAITLHYPKLPAPGAEAKAEFWLNLADELRTIVRRNRSTLIFANSRRTVEKLTRLLNDGEDELLAYSHHGSLSRELRLSVEEQMKAGRLRAIVATASLELGIDIGSIDEVILLGTPASTAQAIQRIGRADHRVGGQSRAQIFTLHGLDGLEATTLMGQIHQNALEETCPVRAPLDVLAQVLLSMGCQTVWKIDQLFAFVRTIAAYHELSRERFDGVIAMLTGRYADAPLHDLRARATFDPINHTFTTRKGTEFLLYQSGGTIPDRGYYNLRLADTHALIGELDEEFVWERRQGDQFTLGTQAWRILRITHNDVEVGPADPGRPMIPFWRAEDRNRSTLVSLALLNFLDECQTRQNDPSFIEDLATKRALPLEDAQRLLEFLYRQRHASGGVLPGRHQIVVECTREGDLPSDTQQVVIHTFWGGRVNRPLAMALSEVWEKRLATPLEIYASNDQILVLLPEGLNPLQLFEPISSHTIESLVRARLQNTALFGAHFRENAARALLLPRGSARRRQPLWLSRLRAKKLLATVTPLENFPIVFETWRQVIEDEFDLPTLKLFLDELTQGHIRLHVAETTHPTPFCDGIIYRQTNYHMYLDDTPLGGTSSGTSDEQLNELFQSANWPRLPPSFVQRFQDKWRRIEPGYEPTTQEDVAYAIREQIGTPLALVNRWIERLNATSPELHDPLAHFVFLTLPGATEPIVCDLTDLPRLLSLRACPLPVQTHPFRSSISLDIAAYVKAHPYQAEADPHTTLLMEYLRQCGPTHLADISAVLGFSTEEITSLAHALDKILIAQPLLEEDAQTYLCTREVFDRLLRLYRSQQRRRTAEHARPLGHLPAFLAEWQGLTKPATTLTSFQTYFERLWGYPLPTELWEEAVLACRALPYHPSWLDSLFQSYGLTWLGCGNDRLTFALAGDLDLFLPTTNEALPPDHDLLQTLAADPRGLSLADLAKQKPSQGDIGQVLWQLAFLGRITTNSFEPVRRQLRGNRARESSAPISLRGRPGRIRSLSHPPADLFRNLPEVPLLDPLETALLEMDRARMVLSRYGVVFRELLERELPALRWSHLFRALRRMELSGEIQAGHFFADIQGLQFATPHALAQLWEQPLTNLLVTMNACDPASPCGLGLNAFSHFPRRISSNWIVIRGTELLLVLQRGGKDVQLYLPLDHPDLPQAMGIFSLLVRRLFHPISVLRVETINGEAAALSSYTDYFRKFGFHADYRSLELDANAITHLIPAGPLR